MQQSGPASQGHAGGVLVVFRWRIEASSLEFGWSDRSAHIASPNNRQTAIGPYVVFSGDHVFYPGVMPTGPENDRLPRVLQHPRVEPMQRFLRLSSSDAPDPVPWVIYREGILLNWIAG